MHVWHEHGDFISSRHASACLERFDHLASDSANAEYATAPTNRSGGLEEISSGDIPKESIKDKIRDLATSETHQSFTNTHINRGHIFLFANGATALSAVCRVVGSVKPPAHRWIAYGWQPGRTRDILLSNISGDVEFCMDTNDYLCQLEQSLEAGQNLDALFCTFPNILTLKCPDLWRIHNLAVKHRFIVICDDSVANSVDVDLFPFVDIRVTSLTRTFSGTCNVAGGSVVVNPDSQYYELISTKLESMPDTLHPHDAMVLSRNCQNIEQRVSECNANARSVVKLLAGSHIVKRVNHPSCPDMKMLYDRHRREGGGYGHVLTVEFQRSHQAKLFYYALSIAKGPGYGTSFSICLPPIIYEHREAQLLERYDIPAHLLLLSIGTGKKQVIKDAVKEALMKTIRPILLRYRWTF
ncbi:pyridoxal phosphate-dependent transferase [Aspergillus carlsbadensis]|nr:pyridoxal phosphate-dependent transferase [Aspergillus carlsbadensis]